MFWRKNKSVPSNLITCLERELNLVADINHVDISFEYITFELRPKQNSYFLFPPVQTKEIFISTVQKNLEQLGKKYNFGFIIIPHSESLSLQIMPDRRFLPPKIPIVHFFLFTITLLSTTYAGFRIVSQNNATPESTFWGGLSYSVSLLTILFCHEIGHFLLARKRGISATLPYFIPFPSLIGTLGAVIKTRSPVLDRRILFDIGFSGPFAGFCISIVLCIIGLKLSTIVQSEPNHLFFGSSLLFYILTKITLGVTPENADIILHPVAFASWIGFLVTSLNLLPVGQLDGGHIVYAMFGSIQKKISIIFSIILFVLGFTISWIWFSWFFISVFILKLYHPPTIVDTVPLGKKRKILGYVAIIIFILTFIPNPIHF